MAFIEQTTMTVNNPEIGELYRMVAKKAKNPRWPTEYKSIPFYPEQERSAMESGMINHDDIILFLGEEKNMHWPDQDWYWWRVYSLKHNLTGHIMIDIDSLTRIK